MRRKISLLLRAATIKAGLLGTEQEKEDAIRDAYQRYRRGLFVFIKERVAPTLDDDEIASAVNDVFCGLAKYVSRGKFTRDGSLKTLLLTMARRKGYDQLRRKTKGHSRYPVCAAVDWVVEKFLYFNKEELELLATVDFAALELLQQRKAITMDNVRSVIATAKKWAAKLEREIFSDENISQALSELRDLFPKTYA